MNLSRFHFASIEEDFHQTSFDCNDEDINDFLNNESLNYQNQRLANTYMFSDNTRDVKAFFCLSNDCINDLGTNSDWNRLHRQVDLPNQKRIRQYPSVKLGRLGVGKEYQGTGLAYELMDFIKQFVYNNKHSACRFLLLDAYNKPKQIKYYLRNGFNFLLSNDMQDRTRIMYFDLKSFDK